MKRRTFLATSLALPLAAASAEPWDAIGQQRRRAEIGALHRKACAGLFDSEGAWVGPHTESTARIRFWHAMSLLAAPETNEKANRILRKCFTDRATFQFTFSHFEFCGAAQLLVKNHAQLQPETRQLLSGLLREGLAHQGSIEFRGYNDNFPAMENVLATLGGELSGEAAARQRGLDGLHHMLELLHRRGLISEYTSPTYTSVTLLCYADIAEHSTDPQARELALEIERRVWMDAAAHFHPPTNLLAGPHSRAYNVDSVGHLGQIHMTLYQAFGDKLWLHPRRFLFPPAAHQVIHHDGDVAFMQVSNVWMASGTYHPTAAMERMLFQKPLPFRVSATTECGESDAAVLIQDGSGEFKKSDELSFYPCTSALSTTYMTGDYAVGSVTSPCGDGNQTDVFHVSYRRAAVPASLQDVGTIFCRYICNDEAPGLEWHDPRNQTGERSLDLLGESGRVYTVQKDGAVLALYQSKGQFIQDYTVLRLALVLPLFGRGLKRLAIGDGTASTSTNPEIVWIEDEYLYAAFRPMIQTNHGRRHAVSITQDHGYATISFYNYEGKPRRFTRKELLGTLNGFVAEVGSKSEFGSYDRFRAHVLAGQVTDTVGAGQRIASYTRPGTQLGMTHGVISGVVKFAVVDGELLKQDAWRTSSL